MCPASLFLTSIRRLSDARFSITVLFQSQVIVSSYSDTTDNEVP